MYEIMKLDERTFYVESPSKVGIYKLDEKNIVLIDSGSSRDAARKTLRQIEKEGWEVKTIINTHMHPDHISGNQYFQNNTGCNIIVPQGELFAVENPQHFELFFFIGKLPEIMKKSFHFAKNSKVEAITDDNLPEGMEIVTIKGHSIEQIAIKTSDDVWFLGDGFLGIQAIEKYQILYVYDLGEFLNSLELMKEIDGKIFVPSHGPVIYSKEEIIEICNLNKAKVEEIIENIKDVCKTPTHLDGIVKSMFEKYDMQHSLEQHYLIQATVNGYLSYLIQNEILEIILDNNELRWQLVEKV